MRALFSVLLLLSGGGVSARFLGKNQEEVAPGATTQASCDKLEAMENKFREQLDAFEKEWVAVSQKYETRICEGLGCEPVEHKRMQYKVEWGQIERSFGARKDHLMRMLLDIEKAIKTPPMSRCGNFQARLEEERMLEHGRERLEKGATESVAGKGGGGGGEEKAEEKKPPAGPELSKEQAAGAAEADDEPEDSMELEPPKVHLKDGPFPADNLEEFGPETSVHEEIPPAPACQTWTTYKEQFLGGWTKKENKKSCHSMAEAKKLCMEEPTCGGINKQFDECDGEGWTLRGSSAPRTPRKVEKYAGKLESIALDRNCQEPAADRL